MVIKDREYWIELLDKLNSSIDLKEILRETLKDLCEHFDFGIGFAYIADYNGVLHLNESYGYYPGNLPLTISHDELTDEESTLLKQKKSVCFRFNTINTPLKVKIAVKFDARSMVFVPVFSDEGILSACVAIMDRRGQARKKDSDLDFIRAVLTTLGTYVKIQQYREKAEHTYQALDSVLNHMGIDVYVNDFETHEMLYVNESMANPYGDVEKIIGTVCYEILYEDKTEECEFCPKPQLIDEEGKPTKVYGWDYQRPFDGSWFRVLSSAFPWTDGRMAQVISSVDITENKRNEELIRQMAQRDALTGLANRYRLGEDLNFLMPHWIDSQEEGYIIFFDLNGFKAVNDTLGHDAGDELLTQIGEFILKGPGVADDCYRYGGDEFVIIWDMRKTTSLAKIMDYLLEGFSTPWEVGGQEVNCGAAIGIATVPVDTTEATKILGLADSAMYRSKEEKVRSNKWVAAYAYNQGQMITWEEYREQENL